MREISKDRSEIEKGSGVYITIDQHPLYKSKMFPMGGIQISVDDDNGGYRIAGPKFDGTSKRLRQHELTKKDILEIRRYLNKAWARLKDVDQ